jgi:hypothetical protein
MAPPALALVGNGTGLEQVPSPFWRGQAGSLEAGRRSPRSSKNPAPRTSTPLQVAALDAAVHAAGRLRALMDVADALLLSAAAEVGRHALALAASQVMGGSPNFGRVAQSRWWAAGERTEISEDSRSAGQELQRSISSHRE